MRKKTETVVFFGTPKFAVPTLEALIASGRRVPLVVTQPDRRGGRGNAWIAPPVKEAALRLGLKVVQPEKIKAKEFMAGLRDARADVFAVAAFGRILHEEIIAMPAWILNVHASLLPRWRGAAPITRAILAGDEEAGVSIMKIVRELDAGEYATQARTKIASEDTTTTLTDRLAELGAKAMLETLDAIDRDEARFAHQDESLVTYAKPIENEEAKIDWREPVRSVHDRVRAMQDQPGAFVTDGRQRIKIHRTAPADFFGTASPGTPRVDQGRLYVRCGDGWIEVLEAQREGKARQPVASFLQGYKIEESTRW